MTVIMMLVIMVVRMVMTFVIMIVVMRIGRDDPRGLRAEELGEFRIVPHRFRPAFAADMAVEADDAVAFRHDHVEIMRHHQYAAAMAPPDLGDELVELGLADEVDRLHRLVQHQEFRPAQKRPRHLPQRPCLLRRRAGSGAARS